MIYLLPQITKDIAEKVISEFAQKGNIEDADINNQPEGIFYTPSGAGGRPIGTHDLYSLREEIVNLAKNYGYYNNSPNKFLEFEYEVAVIFSKWKFLWDSDYPTGESLRNNFWSYLTVVLLPDIATWRWGFPENGEPTKAWTDRMLGGSRNAFQRVFKRVISFDKGKEHHDRLHLIKNLLEDDFSAILERTSLGGNSKIAIFLAEEFIEMRKRCANKNKQIQTDIYRKATKDLTAFGKVQSLDILEDSYLKELIFNVFTRRENQINRNLS